MKKIIYILILAGLTVAMNGCYSNYKNPAPEKIWEDADFIDDGYHIISIHDLKQLYFAAFPNNHAANHIVITTPVVIKGKVVSNDKPGNFYRNMTIQDVTVTDGTGEAIEIKVGKGSLQNEYRVGQIVYVIAENLTLGNYRYMLSLGVESADAKYANDYIDLQVQIDAHIKKGEIVGMTSADTLVVNASNYATKLRDPEDLGRLVRFEGLKSSYVKYNEDYPYPAFSQTTTKTNPQLDPIYTDRVWSVVIAAWDNYYNHGGPEPAATEYTGAEGGFIPYPFLPADRLYPTWGYHDTKTNSSYYGASYFRYDGAPTAAPSAGNINKGNYVVRTSGYSKFANNPLPADGATVTMTAFLNKYSASGGGYQVYQLVLNNSTDVTVTSGKWSNE